MSTPQSALVWNLGRRGLPLDLGLPNACVLAGVEHEYAGWDGAVQQDFRTLLPAIAGDLRALDPGDPRARRLPSGCALTADGWEAEIATPPLPVGPGAPQRLDALLATQRSELAVELAAQGVPRLTGFSTHVNISVRDDRVVDICPASSSLSRSSLRAPSSRPNPNRAQAARAPASVPSGDRWRVRRGRGPRRAGHLRQLAVGALVAGSVPPRGPAPVVVPSREKYGWHLPPEGPYAVLLADGPAAALSVGTSVMTAKELFEVTWRWARPFCLAQGLDPGACDRLAAGRRWRLQGTLPAETCTVLPAPVDDPPALGYDTKSRKRPGGVVAETTWVSWGTSPGASTAARGRCTRSSRRRRRRSSSGASTAGSSTRSSIAGSRGAADDGASWSTPRSPAPPGGTRYGLEPWCPRSATAPASSRACPTAGPCAPTEPSRRAPPR